MPPSTPTTHGHRTRGSAAPWRHNVMALGWTPAASPTRRTPFRTKPASCNARDSRRALSTHPLPFPTRTAGAPSPVPHLSPLRRLPRRPQAGSRPVPGSNVVSGAHSRNAAASQPPSALAQSRRHDPATHEIRSPRRKGGPPSVERAELHDSTRLSSCRHRTSARTSRHPQRTRPPRSRLGNEGDAPALPRGSYGTRSSRPWPDMFKIAPRSSGLPGGSKPLHQERGTCGTRPFQRSCFVLVPMWRAQVPGGRVSTQWRPSGPVVAGVDGSNSVRLALVLFEQRRGYCFLFMRVGILRRCGAGCQSTGTRRGPRREGEGTVAGILRYVGGKARGRDGKAKGPRWENGGTGSVDRRALRGNH